MERKQKLSMPVRYAVNTAVLAVLLAAGSVFVSSGAATRAQTSILLQAGVYIILAVSLNVATGYLGQLPLGHAGFMALGAYCGALVWKATAGAPHALSLCAGLLAGGLLAALFGVLIGIPALRLRGDYLAMITLGFGEIIRVCIINLPQLTGGTPGLLGIPRNANFFVVYVCVILSCTAIHMMMKSRTGRAILAVRENEIAAEACGISTTYYKVLAFAVSAFFAGIAGALYGGIQGSLFPDKFSFAESINILVMVVLGGMGSMAGSVIAAVVLTALPLLLQGFSEYRMVVYSLLLIGVMVFKPTGLLGTYDFSLSRLLERGLRRVRKREVNHE